MMDPQMIYQLLEATMHPDAALRGNVEHQLKTVSRVEEIFIIKNAHLNFMKHEMSPGFLIALLTILRADSNKNVRQAAAIYFKNRVQQGWDSAKKTAIHDHDKDVVRQNILGVLLEVNEVGSIR
jgi:hypothetical protein